MPALKPPQAALGAQASSAKALRSGVPGRRLPAGMLTAVRLLPLTKASSKRARSDVRLSVARSDSASWPVIL